VCVCFGGSGSDSRQRGSVMAGYWIRLQPELPQYAQYNVPLCSLCCPTSSHLQPGPFLPGGPQSRQKHTRKNNTQGHRGTHSHRPGREKCTDTPCETRSSKYETGQGRKTDRHSAQTPFILPLPAPSALLTITAHRWLRPFDVNAAYYAAVIKTGNRTPRHVREVKTSAVGRDYSSPYSYTY